MCIELTTAGDLELRLLRIVLLIKLKDWIKQQANVMTMANYTLSVTYILRYYNFYAFYNKTKNITSCTSIEI